MRERLDFFSLYFPVGQSVDKNLTPNPNCLADCRLVYTDTRGSGQIAQIVESEKWLNEDGICDRTFDLVTKPKVVTPQGKSRLFTRRAIEQSQEGRRQECIARAARRRRLIAQGLYIDEMESVL